jgi:predicted nucleic acid-binding protein
VSIVVDASMTIAWLFADERTDAAHAVMLRVVSGGAVVPSLWRLEVANVLRNAVRRGRCDEAYVDRSLERLSRFPVEIDEETSMHACTATHTLSREQGLTHYDAAYLELAVRRSQPLATCDAELIAAASRRGLEVLTA